MSEFVAQEHRFPLDRVHLMGILNANDDSFCGDGSLNEHELLRQARRHIDEGADILDVGGESARTNRDSISREEEIRRVVPVIRALRREFAQVPVSLNTWRTAVAEAGLAAGAAILNDMSGLPDPANARIAAAHGAGLVVMHLQGEPKQSHTHAAYADVVAEIGDFFGRRIVLAKECGLGAENLLLDPGLDFAKQRDDNLRVLRGLTRLTGLGAALLVADSRKTFIGEILDRPPIERDWGTLAASLWAVEQGARFLRVHNVAIHRDAVKVWEAAREASKV
jgi:dihydropteroate synthase